MEWIERGVKNDSMWTLERCSCHWDCRSGNIWAWRSEAGLCIHYLRVLLECENLLLGPAIQNLIQFPFQKCWLRWNRTVPMASWETWTSPKVHWAAYTCGLKPCTIFLRLVNTWKHCVLHITDSLTIYDGHCRVTQQWFSEIPSVPNSDPKQYLHLNSYVSMSSN